MPVTGVVTAADWIGWGRTSRRKDGKEEEEEEMRKSRPQVSPTGFFVSSPGEEKEIATVGRSVRPSEVKLPRKGNIVSRPSVPLPCCAITEANGEGRCCSYSLFLSFL